MLLSLAHAQYSYLGVSQPTGCIGPSGIAYCNKTSVFVGNSITLGQLPVDLGANRWTSLFCNAKNATESNLGINGLALQTTCVAMLDSSTIPTYNSAVHAALFIDIGTNDVGINNGSTTAALFAARLRRVIDYWHNTKGWPYSIMHVIAQYYAYDYTAYGTTCGTTTADQTRGKLYADSTMAVAADKGCIGINMRQIMIDNGITTVGYFNSDHLHLAANAHAFVAGYLINHL